MIELKEDGRLQVWERTAIVAIGAEVAVTSTSSRCRATLPATIAEQMGLKEGDPVRVSTCIEAARPGMAGEAPGEIDQRFANAVAAAFSVPRGEPRVTIPASVTAKMEAGKTYYIDPKSGAVRDENWHPVEAESGVRTLLVKTGTLHIIDPPFKVGDVVQVKGWPPAPMTIDRINGMAVECVRFYGDHLCRDLYYAGDLTRVETKAVKPVPLDPFAKDWTTPYVPSDETIKAVCEQAASPEPEGRRINFREWT